MYLRTNQHYFIKTKAWPRLNIQDNFQGVCKQTWLTGTYFLFSLLRHRFTSPYANITMGIHSLNVHQWMAAGGTQEPDQIAEVTCEISIW